MKTTTNAVKHFVEKSKSKRLIGSRGVDSAAAMLELLLVMALQPFVVPWPLFQSLISPWTRGSDSRKAATYTQDNTDTQTSMP
jgi:acetyl esterase/lipase